MICSILKKCCSLYSKGEMVMQRISIPLFANQAQADSVCWSKDAATNTIL